MSGDLASMSTWHHADYIAAAVAAHPEKCGGHDLAVGWKITRPDSTTRDGAYRWPVPDDVGRPVLHEATDWDESNRKSCPRQPGDGLCLVTDDGIAEASSGGISLSVGLGHILVYPADLAAGNEPGKWRVPWCVDVATFMPLDMIRTGFVANLAGANLSGAYLAGAYLAGANLSGANLAGAYLAWANLSGAYLARANLAGANLTGANLTGAYLARAYLARAKLARANLTGANLTGAILARAILTGAIGVEQ